MEHCGLTNQATAVSSRSAPTAEFPKMSEETTKMLSA